MSYDDPDLALKQRYFALIRHEMLVREDTGASVARHVHHSANWVNRCLRGDYLYPEWYELPTYLEHYVTDWLHLLSFNAYKANPWPDPETERPLRRAYLDLVKATLKERRISGAALARYRFPSEPAWALTGFTLKLNQVLRGHHPVRGDCSWFPWLGAYFVGELHLPTFEAYKASGGVNERLATEAPSGR